MERSKLLGKRHQLTESLFHQPYDLILYLERAVVHSELGYPDLAAGDSYRALLLSDEVNDETFEYHEQALEALQSYSAGEPPAVLFNHETSCGDLNGEAKGLDEIVRHSKTALILAHRASTRAYQLLSASLLLCGCLKSSYDLCLRGLAVSPGNAELLKTKDSIEHVAKTRLNVTEVDINDLLDQGRARREIYPWNDHEPDRFSEESLAFLNEELATVASKCEVRVTELPNLFHTASDKDGNDVINTTKQLGLFAKDDILPGEPVLQEFSVLTANNRLKESLCEACSTELPPLDATSTVVGCPECDDAIFCDEDCLARAQAYYHSSICDKDIDTIAKDPDPKESPNALYLLLLARALSMSAAQECHPLNLKEVKYIWGDFLPSTSTTIPLSELEYPPHTWTLPFSFASNISGPLHVLEKMDIDIFASLADFDLWIFNTLYSKFRGTASARVSTRDGLPEVAAVHPLWCLANHDCDPNVQWEWGGRMNLWCREKRVDGSAGGIKRGEEILNHYCDIDLKVQDRREWAMGSLGGMCMCNRCRTEAAAEQEGRSSRSK